MKKMIQKEKETAQEQNDGAAIQQEYITIVKLRNVIQKIHIEKRPGHD